MVKRWPWQGTPKKFSRSSEYFSGVQNSYLTSINWKINSKKSGVVARTLYFLEKKDIKQAFSPSCRNWPICVLEQLFGSKYILVRAAVHWAGHRLSHTGHQPSSLFAKKPLRSSWEIEAAQLTNFLLAARCRPPFLAGPGFWPPVTSHTCLIDFEGFWNLSRHWWSSSTVHRTLRKRTSQSLCDGLEYLSKDCAIPADIASSHKKWPRQSTLLSVEPL